MNYVGFQEMITNQLI